MLRVKCKAANVLRGRTLFFGSVVYVLSKALVARMESKKQAAKFCGNILVRKAKRRSFLAKSLFESVFGVLTEASFEYYQSSAQWVGQ